MKNLFQSFFDKINVFHHILVVGCGIVLGKDYYKKFKEKFKEAKEA